MHVITCWNQFRFYSVPVDYLHLFRWNQLARFFKLVDDISSYKTSFITSSNYCAEWNKWILEDHHHLPPPPKKSLAMVDAVSQSSERYFIGKYFSILGMDNRCQLGWLRSFPRIPCMLFKFGSLPSNIITQNHMKWWPCECAQAFCHMRDKGIYCNYSERHQYNHFKINSVTIVPWFTKKHFVMFCHRVHQGLKRKWVNDGQIWFHVQEKL